MAILEMQRINKSFHGIPVLKNVDLSVEKGEVHALCGENGAGKSTLMKILTGIYERDSGDITFKGQPVTGMNVQQIQRLGISMIFQELNLLNELTVAQNIFLNREKVKKGMVLNEKEMVSRTAELLQEAEHIDPAEKVRNLSIAQKQIVEIIKAISFNAELIIMDEPTAVLTKNEVDILYSLIGKLKAAGVSVIYISHRLPEIKEICDRITILRDGEKIATVNTADISERDIAKLMVGRDIEPNKVERADGQSKKEIFRAEHITSGNMVKDVSFTLYTGETLGFYGLVGAGRSELAEAIFGIRPKETGELFINGEKVEIKTPSEAIARRIAFATEDRRGSGLFPERSIMENMTVIRHIKTKTPIIDKREEKQITKDMQQALRIKYASERDEVIGLSGGNQQKVVFGKWAAGDADIFIFDEPTRGVDIGARKEIYAYINKLTREGKAVMIISSDLPELLETCQRIAVMYQGELRGELSNEEATEERIMMMATGIERG